LGFGRFRLAGDPVVRREARDEVAPGAVTLFCEADVRGRLESVAPRPNRTVRVRGRPVYLVVHLPQELEGGVVVAEEHMQPVLLDPAVLAPTAGTLATQTPAALVDGDRREIVLPVAAAQLPRGGQSRHPSPQDDD